MKNSRKLTSSPSVSSPAAPKAWPSRPAAVPEEELLGDGKLFGVVLPPLERYQVGVLAGGSGHAAELCSCLSRYAAPFSSLASSPTLSWMALGVNAPNSTCDAFLAEWHELSDSFLDPLFI